MIQNSDSVSIILYGDTIYCTILYYTIDCMVILYDHFQGSLGSPEQLCVLSSEAHVSFQIGNDF